jgi:triacylglycerol esterase/lipase EstA (alpha/beta hydrolase family)
MGAACAACAAVGLVATSLGAAPVSAAPSTAASKAPLPVGTIFQGVAADLSDPGGTPPGMNDWSCRPSKQHPYPVILMHGTLFNENLTWQALSPELANAGYCVYGFDYGGGSDAAYGVYGATDIPTSAEQLATFVNYVRISTGARQVDMVGHSQGGMLPRYYMKYLRGASNVHLLIGLAPSNHGTTLNGADALLAALHGVGINVLTIAGCVACTQQINGSNGDFIAQLNAGGDTLPGPRYVVIESMYDEVVTPYQSAFLTGPRVQNILLQAQCPTDFSEHIGIVYDPVALQDVMNALGPDDPHFRPACSVEPPGVG